MSIRKRSQDAGNIEVPHILARYAAIRPKLLVTGCRVNVPVSSTKQKKMAPTTRHKIQGGAASAGWHFSVGVVPAILAIALAAAFVAAPALAKPHSIEVAHGRAHLRRAESRWVSRTGNRMEPRRKTHLVSRARGRARRDVDDGRGERRPQGSRERQRARGRDAPAKRQHDSSPRASAASRRKTISGRPRATRCFLSAAAIWCYSI